MRLAGCVRYIQLLSTLTLVSSLTNFALPLSTSSCTMVSSNTTRLPTAFVSHGGGPSFFIEAKKGDALYDISKGSEGEKSLQRLPKQLGAEKPSAIVIVSGHYEGPKVLVTGKSQYDKLYYDYGGFPDYTYKIEYKAPGDAHLAKRITEMLKGKGIDSELDLTRNWDHGVFVPLKVMYPNADIPVVEISLLHSYDAKAHIDIGKALAPLRDEGVLILGSGYATHTWGADPAKNRIFVSAVTELVQNATPEDRLKAFENWETALPHARNAHRQEDHWLPMLVVVGAAGEDKGKEMYRTDSLGGKMSFAHWAFGV